MFIEKYPFVYLRHQAILIGACGRCKCKLSYEKKKKKKNATWQKTTRKSIRPMDDSKRKSPSPVIFPHTMRQNILYCGQSYSFHRYSRQKILRLVIVFTVLTARGVRFFFSIHFYRCNCISITVCYFIEKYSCNCIFFCK